MITEVIFKEAEITEEDYRIRGEFYVDGTCICRTAPAYGQSPLIDKFKVPLRIDFMVKQHEPERLGPEPTIQLLAAFNSLISGIKGFGGQVPEGLMKAIDRLMYNHGYKGKIVDDEYKYPKHPMFNETYARELF